MKGYTLTINSIKITNPATLAKFPSAMADVTASNGITYQAEVTLRLANGGFWVVDNVNLFEEDDDPNLNGDTIYELEEQVAYRLMPIFNEAYAFANQAFEDAQTHA